MATRTLAHVYRLDPTSAQRVALARLVGCRRFVDNWGLARCRETYAATGKKSTYNALAATLTELKRDPDHLWLAEVDSQALPQALRDLDRAYTNCFARRARYPRFASKHRGDQTARIPQRVRVDEAAATVTIPKIGAVNLHRSRPLQGVVKSATMRRDRCGDWFVSLRLAAPVPVDAPVSPEQALTNAVGIDLGLTTDATRSDGVAIRNPRHLRAGQRARKHAQRDCSRKRKGSKNRKKSRAKLAKLHRKVARQRADFPHQLTTSLVRRYDLLCVEDRTIRGLGRTKLARSMDDAAFGERVRQGTDKVTWDGQHLVRVGRFSPSSQTCHRCGWVYAGLTRKERDWTCAACGVTHDRDANAARNVLFAGTRRFALRHAAGEQGGGTCTTPTPSPASRRDRPRRKTPVDGASDDPSGPLRRAKQESHTLEGWEVSTCDLSLNSSLNTVQKRAALQEVEAWKAAMGRRGMADRPETIIASVAQRAQPPQLRAHETEGSTRRQMPAGGRGEGSIVSFSRAERIAIGP